MPNKPIDEYELKTLLVNAGYKMEELEKFSKRQLKSEWDKIQSASQILDTAKIDAAAEGVNTPLLNMGGCGADSFGTFEEKVDKVDNQLPVTIAPTDPEWTDFVMSQFKDNELENKNPKTDALRRVAEKLLGIFDIDTHVIQVPQLDGGATVVVTLQFHNPRRSVSGAADVSSINTAKEFAVHAVATAETRAEGRALRKALRLTKVLAAEELHNADTDEPNGLDGRAPASMLNSLRLMCNKQKIDLDRLAKVKLNVDSINDLTLTQGRQLSTQLFDYGRKPEEIPDEVKTF